MMILTDDGAGNGDDDGVDNDGDDDGDGDGNTIWHFNFSSNCEQTNRK